MYHDIPLTRIEATSRTVRRGDIINIGGSPLRVTNLVALSNGGRWLYFETGEALVVQSDTPLVALRPQPSTTSPATRPPWDPASPFPSPHPRDGHRPNRPPER